MKQMMKISLDATKFPSILDRKNWSTEGDECVQVLPDGDHMLHYFRMLFESTGVPFELKPVVTVEAQAPVKKTTRKKLPKKSVKKPLKKAVVKKKLNKKKKK
jgi:hypothetical protein